MFTLSWLRNWFRSAPKRRSARPVRFLLEELEPREVLSGNSFLLDFGNATSPLAPEYTRVNLATYSAESGFGWDNLDGLQAKDRRSGDPLTQDFHFGLAKPGADHTFFVNVPNSIYEVTVTLGGGSPIDRLDLLAEGRTVASNLSVAYQEYSEQTFRVEVKDGQLDLRFVDRGGASRYWSVAALKLVEVTPVTASIDDVTVKEGDNGTTTATFTVNLSRASSQLISMHYSTANGSAGSADYTPVSGMINFSPGMTSQTISVNVAGDFYHESNEDFFVNLFDATNAIIADGQGHGVILDDDSALNIVIDESWLAQQGAGPYVLDQAGSTYILTTDVRTVGTAFVVGAANVTLNLNGHTVTYGDSAPVTVVNAGFEQGSGRNVPGWDLSGASSAAIAANTNFLFGDQVLRLNNYTTTQRIVSDPIAISLIGHTYTATITPAKPDTRSTVRVSVIDTVTGAVLGTGLSDNTERGFSAVAHFTATTTHSIRLVVEVNSLYGTPESVDLDQATLTVSGDYGIFASRAWSGDILGYSNLSAKAQAVYKNAANFTVKNGSIVQGQGDGYGSSALNLRYIPGVTVDSVETYASGMDTQSLDATYATVGVTIRNSTFREDIDNISNRMDNFATLKLNAINGPIVIEGNKLLGSPQIGIMLAGNNPAYTVSIRNNEIRQSAVTTNGYAILFSTVQNFVIADNVIVPTNGKGILLDGYKSALLGHGEIYGNYVEVCETDNREYPTGLETAALRLRNTVDSMGPHQDLYIHDNVFVAVTGPGLVQQAHAARISYANINGAMNDAGIVIENNLFKALALTTDPIYRARALVLDRIDAGINLHFVGNTLESNDVSLGLTDATGSVYDVDFYSTIMRKSSDGPERAYRSVLAGYYNRQIHDVRLFDTRVENGATPTIAWAGTGLKDLSVGWLLDVRVRDSAGVPLAGATVQVFDKAGNVVATGVTSADGWLRDVAVATTLYTQTTTDARKITTVNQGPFEVKATFEGVTISQQVDLTANLEVFLTLF